MPIYDVQIVNSIRLLADDEQEARIKAIGLAEFATMVTDGTKLVAKEVEK